MHSYYVTLNRNTFATRIRHNLSFCMCAATVLFAIFFFIFYFQSILVKCDSGLTPLRKAVKNKDIKNLIYFKIVECTIFPLWGRKSQFWKAPIFTADRQEFNLWSRGEFNYFILVIYWKKETVNLNGGIFLFDFPFKTSFFQLEEISLVKRQADFPIGFHEE